MTHLIKIGGKWLNPRHVFSLRKINNNETTIVMADLEHNALIGHDEAAAILNGAPPYDGPKLVELICRCGEGTTIPGKTLVKDVPNCRGCGERFFIERVF